MMHSIVVLLNRNVPLNKTLIVNERFFDDHKAISLGILSVLVAMILAVYPLSFGCRRRKRRPRRVSRLQLEDDGDFVDGDGAVMDGDVTTGSRSDNGIGQTCFESRDDEARIEVDTHELVLSEFTPLMTRTGCNKLKATGLSELATARLRGAEESYHGSEVSFTAP